jgi:hypothetical protein
MKRILHACLFLAFISSVHAQVTLTLTGPDYNPSNPLNCAGIVPTGGTNFIDGTGNYTPNMNETLVLCPDLTQGSKVSISFATNIGFEWDVHPTDTLYIYDGSSTAAPLLGRLQQWYAPRWLVCTSLLEQPHWLSNFAFQI